MESKLIEWTYICVLKRKQIASFVIVTRCLDHSDDFFNTQRMLILIHHNCSKSKRKFVSSISSKWKFLRPENLLTSTTPSYRRFVAPNPFPVVWFGTTISIPDCFRSKSNPTHCNDCWQRKDFDRLGIPRSVFDIEMLASNRWRLFCSTCRCL